MKRGSKCFLKNKKVHNYEKLIFSFATIVAVASAASYNPLSTSRIPQGDQKLKPGEYKLEVKKGTTPLSSGTEKRRSRHQVKVENSDTKYNATSIRYSTASEIQEIRLRGTNTKLVFTGTSGSVGQQ